MLSVKQIEDIKVQAFACEPSVLNGVCQVYPLTMREIIHIGINKYYSLLGTLLLTPAKISEIIREKTGEDFPPSEIDVLQYLLLSSEQNDMFFLELQSAFTTFIKEDIYFLPTMNTIVVGSPEDKRFITSENFKDFQDILRIQNRKEVEKPPPEDETPGERKMRLLRERVAEAKRRQAEKKQRTDSSDFDSMLEIASVYGIDYKNESLYAFYGLIRRYQAEEKWRQDIQMLCAGADSKKLKTKYWGESLKDE